ncbi:MAG: GlxA family transcriptional regulator, partial [Porticoccaceae bacterium]|nr:GlxA family transcriptional regulator [Porticoccaceae bacterium]
MSENVDTIAVEAVTLHIGFILLPEYTLSTFSNAVGILRMANRLSGQKLYRWSLHSLDGQPLLSSAGLELALDGSLDDASEANIMLV